MQNKQKFQPKEISNFFNIASDTIRYYDRRGLVSPSREKENNYRWYDFNNLCNLHTLLQTRSADFPLEKMKAFYDTEDLSFLLKSYEEHEQYLLKEISKLEHKLLVSNNARKYISNIRTTKSEFSLQYWPIWQFIDTGQPKTLLSFMEEFYKIREEHTHPMTYAFIKSKEAFLNSNNEYKSYGLWVDSPDYVHPLHKTIHYEPTLCVYHLYRGRAENLPFTYIRINNWLQKNHYTIRDDIIERFILGCPDKIYVELWIPIDK